MADLDVRVTGFPRRPLLFKVNYSGDNSPRYYSDFVQITNADSYSLCTSTQTIVTFPTSGQILLNEPVSDVVDRFIGFGFEVVELNPS